MQRKHTTEIDGIVIRHEYVEADRVRLHVAIAGEGPPVVLLHGFPEHWWSWRRQLPALVRSGFSVWAPDMRGYNLSDRPLAVSAYRLRHLVSDVAALIRATDQPRVHLGGHDWGGVVAWTFAAHHPELVDRLVICNAPHMGVYMQKVWRTTQLLRSAYVPLFLLRGVAEWILRARRYAAVRRMMPALAARPDVFSQADLDTYVEALSRPGALTAGLNYYRANVFSKDLVWAQAAPTMAETLVVWGMRDPALSPQLLDGLQNAAPNARVHRVAGAGHWVHIEAPEEVNRVVTGFLQGAS